MKKITAALFTAFVALVIIPSVVASADTDICGSHMNQKDAAFGYASTGTDPVYVTACSEGSSGPDTQNNAWTPDASPHPDAVQPLSPSTAILDSGTHDETQGIPDDDGLQADDVRSSPIFVPGG